MQKSIESMRRVIPAKRTKSPNIAVFGAAQYKKVEGMIIKATKLAQQRCGLPFEEIKAQADMLFVVACKKYNSRQKTKFSTFLYSVLHNGLIDFGRQERLHDDFQTRVYDLPQEKGGQDILSSIHDERAVAQFELVDMYNSLNSEEKQLVDLVLQGFASSLDALRVLAMDRLGFDPELFDEACYGIRKMLGEMR